MRKRTITAGATSVALLVGGVGALAFASPASAHTPEVTADCNGVTINLTGYQVKPATTDRVVDVPEHDEKVLVTDAYDETVVDQEYVPGTPAVPAQPAVYGDAPVITPAVPAQAAVPAVTHKEYAFVQKITGKVRWEKDPNWNAGPNGKGWSKTGDCKIVVDVPAKPAVPGKDAVYGDAPLITPAVPEQPAVPEVPEVSHVVHHEAEYETKKVPATYKEVTVPGDDLPNTVGITISDKNHTLHQDRVFGTELHDSISFEDTTVANTYTVDVVAWDDPKGDKGWSKQFTGTVEPCEATTPPTTPPTEEPTTPPTGEPTTPAPSDGPTSEPTPSAPVTVPTPTAGTTPPASSPTATATVTPPQVRSGGTPTTHAVPVAADTSRGTLAYTGADLKSLVAGGIAAVALLALGGFILLKRRQAAAARDDS